MKLERALVVVVVKPFLFEVMEFLLAIILQEAVLFFNLYCLVHPSFTMVLRFSEFINLMVQTQLINNIVYKIVKLVHLNVSFVLFRCNVLFVSNSFRDTCLAHEASIGMAWNRCLDIILSVLIGLFLCRKFFNMFSVLFFMLLPAHHHLLVLHVAQQNTLASRDLWSEVRNLRHSLRGELLLD